MVIYFLILTEITSFLLSFVLWSFQVLGKDLMDYGIRSGKSLNLGMPKAPQGNIQGHQASKLGYAPDGIPSFVFVHRSIYLRLYFYSPHDMCFAWSVLYDLSVCFLVCHNHPRCTHLLRGTRMNRDLIEYSMSFTYIFLARQFCSNASRISF